MTHWRENKNPRDKDYSARSVLIGKPKCPSNSSAEHEKRYFHHGCLGLVGPHSLRTRCCCCDQQAGAIRKDISLARAKAEKKVQQLAEQRAALEREVRCLRKENSTAREELRAAAVKACAYEQKTRSLEASVATLMGELTSARASVEASRQEMINVPCDLSAHLMAAMQSDSGKRLLESNSDLAEFWYDQHECMRRRQEGEHLVKGMTWHAT